MNRIIVDVKHLLEWSSLEVSKKILIFSTQILENPFKHLAVIKNTRSWLELRAALICPKTSEKSRVVFSPFNHLKCLPGYLTNLFKHNEAPSQLLAFDTLSGVCFKNISSGFLQPMRFGEEVEAMEKEPACQIIGAPDFSILKCQSCRDSADPLYKECLTARLIQLSIEIDQSYTQSPETLQPE